MVSNEKDAKDILSFIFSRRLILCLLLSAERDGEPLENRRLRMNLTSPISGATSLYFLPSS